MLKPTPDSPPPAATGSTIAALVEGVSGSSRGSPPAVSQFARSAERGYLIPADMSFLAEKLKIQNIEVTVLEEPMKAEGEEFVVDAWTRSSTPATT